MGRGIKINYSFQSNFNVESDRFCIYSIKITVNGKIYIGQTQNKLTYRAKLHFWLLSLNKHSNPMFQKDYNEHGESVFVVSCLDKSATDKIKLNILEGEYSKNHNSAIPDFGYNVIIPGEKQSYSDQTRLTISKKAKERNELNPSICLGNLSKITKESQIKAGKSRSEWLAKNTNPSSRPIIAYNRQNGRQYFFWCVREAAKNLGLNATTVHRNLNKMAYSKQAVVHNRTPYYFAYYG